MPHPINIAFVGCGLIAQAHWQAIQSHAPQFQVTAVIDTNPDALTAMAAKTGAQPFTSLEDALAHADFDAVDIMTPHHLHERMAITAFEAGKHVIMEKPMATTLPACDRVLAAAEQAGTVFMIAEQSQYWPGVTKIQQLIKDGVIGEVVTAEAFFGGPYDGNWGVDSWRTRRDAAGGGLVIDGGAHWIRPLRLWMGEIDEVIAALGHPLQEMEGETLAHAIFRFESGKYAYFKTLVVGSVMAPSEFFRVTGTGGIVVIENKPDGHVVLYTPDHPDGLQLMSVDAMMSEAFGLELADFADAIQYGTPLAAGPEASLGELRTALAMYRSAKTRQWEKVVIASAGQT